MELIDSHAHLDGEKFADDRAAVIERARESGVVKIITMGDSLESSARSVALTEEFESVYAAVGIHPEEAQPMTAATDDRLAAWAAQEKVVAIGEIGLDYYWEKGEEKRALQRAIFVRCSVRSSCASSISRVSSGCPSASTTARRTAT